jgi:ribosomal protein L21E
MHDTGGALDMFEVIIPPNCRMPMPHHHFHIPTGRVVEVGTQVTI